MVERVWDYAGRQPRFWLTGLLAAADAKDDDEDWW